jgi:FK506-binding protein 2
MAIPRQQHRQQQVQERYANLSEIARALIRLGAAILRLLLAIVAFIAAVTRLACVRYQRPMGRVYFSINNGTQCIVMMTIIMLLAVSSPTCHGFQQIRDSSPSAPGDAVLLDASSSKNTRTTRNIHSYPICHATRTTTKSLFCFPGDADVGAVGDRSDDPPFCHRQLAPLSASSDELDHTEKSSSTKKQSLANQRSSSPAQLERREFLNTATTGLCSSFLAFSIGLFTSESSSGAAPAVLEGATSGAAAASGAAALPDLARVSVTLQSPSDRLGLELIEVVIGTPPRTVVAIQRVLQQQSASSSSSSSAAALSKLQSGMVLEGYSSIQELASKRQQQSSSTSPLTLTFRNLAAGGDAISDAGTPLVTAQDALNLAQRTAGSHSTTTSESTTTTTDEFMIQVLETPASPCTIASRRNDVLEIHYTATYQNASIKNGKTFQYDSSFERGTGQPYQMVLGSGDMLNGVDQGLYRMCPGERRRLTIPSPLAYASRGNRLFQIPPDATLIWDVTLISVNGAGPNDGRTRDEMEGREAYR